MTKSEKEAAASRREMKLLTIALYFSVAMLLSSTALMVVLTLLGFPLTR